MKGREGNTTRNDGRAWGSHWEADFLVKWDLQAEEAFEAGRRLVRCTSRVLRMPRFKIETRQSHVKVSSFPLSLRVHESRQEKLSKTGSAIWGFIEAKDSSCEEARSLKIGATRTHAFPLTNKLPFACKAVGGRGFTSSAMYET